MNKQFIINEVFPFRDVTYFVSGIIRGQEIAVGDILVSERTQKQYKIVGVSFIPFQAHSEGKREFVLRPLDGESIVESGDVLSVMDSETQ